MSTFGISLHCEFTEDQIPYPFPSYILQDSISRDAKPPVLIPSSNASTSHLDNKTFPSLMKIQGRSESCLNLIFTSLRDPSQTISKAVLKMVYKTSFGNNYPFLETIMTSSPAFPSRMMGFVILSSSS